MTCTMARWEKVFYGLLGALLTALCLFQIAAVIVHYLHFPGASKPELKTYDPFRYPYIIYCEEAPTPTADEQILAQALTMPSLPSKAALGQVKGWDQNKQDSIMQTLGSKKQALKNMAPKCGRVTKKCTLGTQEQNCCQNATNVVTQYGSCLLIDIATEMNVKTGPIPIESLKIDFTPTTGRAWIAVSDFHEFFPTTWVKLYAGNEHQMGIDSTMMNAPDPIRRHFGDIGEIKKPFDKETVGINEVTYLNDIIKDKCGCEFSFEGGCDLGKELECVAPLLESFIYGKESRPFFRNGQHYYKFFSRASRTQPVTGSNDIELEMRYESQWMVVSNIYFELSLAQLFWLIGTHIAIWLSVGILVFFFVQLCKCCCRCCRSEEKKIYA